MYNSYFGFLESPFSATPDPRFFYTNPVYQEAYAILRYGISAKKGFIVITGEVGTGKTTLLRKLMHNLPAIHDSVFIFNTELRFPELLQFIFHDLGLAPKDASKVTMLQELNNYLIKQLKQDHIVSVLVDEAQNLSDEALEGLRLLSNLETDQEKLLQIVLAGQPELESRLDQPTLRQLKQRVALRGRLARLQDEEVGPYIGFRLRAAGYEGKDLFHPDAVQEIAFYSKGIPRLVNNICDNALINAFAASQKIVSADMIREAARDLRLESEAQLTEAETTSTALVSKTEPETLIREAASNVPQRKVRRMVRVGFEAFLVILVFVALASVIDPQNLRSRAGRGLEVAQHNLSQWGVLFIHQEVPVIHQEAVPVIDEEAVPEKAGAEVNFKRKDQRVTIRYGSHIYKIATDTYGANALLGMDLIGEFNPQIKNLNRVSAGQDLLLPALTPETLLRKQFDGSYHVIVASFRSAREADEYARLLGNKGYRIVITPRKLSDGLLLHRVEVGGLKNLEEANQILESGLANEGPALANNP